jgi:hypothetical protein
MRLAEKRALKKTLEARETASLAFSCLSADRRESRQACDWAIAGAANESSVSDTGAATAERFS